MPRMQTVSFFQPDFYFGCGLLVLYLYTLAFGILDQEQVRHIVEPAKPDVLVCSSRLIDIKNPVIRILILRTV